MTRTVNLTLAAALVAAILAALNSPDKETQATARTLWKTRTSEKRAASMARVEAAKEKGSRDGN